MKRVLSETKIESVVRKANNFLDSNSEVKWHEIKKEFALTDEELKEAKQKYDSHYEVV